MTGSLDQFASGNFSTKKGLLFTLGKSFEDSNKEDFHGKTL